MKRAVLGVTGLTAAALCMGAAPTATADTLDTSATAAVEWSATHGSSTASGTRWTERSSSGIGSALVITGELRNTGSECHSIWVRWTYDFVTLPYAKRVTQCGTGSAPVDIRLDPYWPTTTGSLKVCSGTADTQDCGEAVSLTSWPVKQGAN